MDEKKQEAFIQFLMEALGIESQEELELALQKLSKEQLQQLMAAFEEQYDDEGEEETPMAKFGMKICPKGTKAISFKAGGKTCRVCVGKKKSPAERFKMTKTKK